jgi:hypothetical protein
LAVFAGCSFWAEIRFGAAAFSTVADQPYPSSGDEFGLVFRTLAAAALGALVLAALMLPVTRGQDLAELQGVADLAG